LVVAIFPAPDKITLDHLSSLEFEGKKFMQSTPISSVLAFSKQFPFRTMPTYPIFSNSQVTQLINAFGSGIHRLPVFDNQNNIINFISQTDLLRFVAENSFSLGKKRTQTVQQLSLYREIVYFVRSDIMTVLALNYMVQQKVSALPILNTVGRLVGTFSASDLRELKETDFPQLLRPISDFLGILSPKSLFPLTCKKTDTFEYVIFKIVATRVHRLWCVDENDQLLGVISITDIFKNYFMSPMEF
jgi:CBS-domain-containing membrane protein